MKPLPLLVVAFVLTSTAAAFVDTRVVSSLLSGPSLSAANPEMERLAKALLGDWNTTETMERGTFFPNGGSRSGTVHARLASGGHVLLYEVHSDGSAGKLDGFHTIWWDPKTHQYFFFACFNDPDGPCRMRGTAHWEGESFVNDYDESGTDGKPTHWRDTFTFAPNSHTLIAAVDSGNGTMKTIITTVATRDATHAK